MPSIHDRLSFLGSRSSPEFLQITPHPLISTVLSIIHFHVYNNLHNRFSHSIIAHCIHRHHARQSPRSLQNSRGVTRPRSLLPWNESSEFRGKIPGKSSGG